MNSTSYSAQKTLREPVRASETRADLERSVLSAVVTGMVRDPNLLGDVLDICPASYFVTPDYEPLAKALELLRESGERPEIPTLAIQMRERWASDPSRWPEPPTARIAELTLGLWGNKGQAEFLARRLANEAKREMLRDGMLKISADASVYGVDSDEVAYRLRSLGESFVGAQESASMTAIFDRIRERLDSPQSLRKTPIPWQGLRNVLRGGLMPGELIVVAARPGLGKTAFALNLALETAKQAIPVLFVSCEMSEEALGYRMISKVGKIDGLFFRDGIEVTPQIRGAIDGAIGELESLPLSVIEKSTVPMCPKEVRRLARSVEDVGLVVVDYLQLLHPDKLSNSRERDVAEMSRAFKQLALDLQIPVVLLSQLNRSSEEGREPRVSDLRESGAIEQDADIVILLHTPQDSRAAQVAPVKAIVGKSRNTGTGVAYLNFSKAFSDFTDGTPWKERERAKDIEL